MDFDWISGINTRELVSLPSLFSDIDGAENKKSFAKY
jgi:hypothetical protein